MLCCNSHTNHGSFGSSGGVGGGCLCSSATVTALLEMGKRVLLRQEQGRRGTVCLSGLANSPRHPAHCQHLRAVAPHDIVPAGNCIAQVWATWVRQHRAVGGHGGMGRDADFLWCRYKTQVCCLQQGLPYAGSPLAESAPLEQPARGRQEGLAMPRMTWADKTSTGRSPYMAALPKALHLYVALELLCRQTRIPDCASQASKKGQRTCTPATSKRPHLLRAVLTAQASRPGR